MSMRAKEVIDQSWFPMMDSWLYQEPLNKLSTSILPNISHQPEVKNIFRVFGMPVSQIRVVILGQDPYPIPGDAIGYAFLNPNKTPKSLQIITKEIVNSDYERVRSYEEEGQQHKRVSSMLWPQQGVFLLNTALTVETGKAGSHLKYWEKFTQQVIMHISKQTPCIWVLWGRKAQKFSGFIHSSFDVKGYDRRTIEGIPMYPDKNYVLTAPHPAAEAYAGGKAGFYGCNHFYFVNKILEKQGKPLITW